MIIYSICIHNRLLTINWVYNRSYYYTVNYLRLSVNDVRLHRKPDGDHVLFAPVTSLLPRRTAGRATVESRKRKRASTSPVTGRGKKWSSTVNNGRTLSTTTVLYEFNENNVAKSRSHSRRHLIKLKKSQSSGERPFCMSVCVVFFFF